MTRAAAPIESLFSPALAKNGTVFTDGSLYAYVFRARDANGAALGLRAKLWQDPDRATEYPKGFVNLDGSGRPISVDPNGTYHGVYGDGVVLLRSYAQGTSAPDPDSDLDDLAAFPPDREEVFYPREDEVHATHFGARGDGDHEKPGAGQDNTDFLQAALDHCLLVDYDPRGPNARRLNLPGGTYRITRPLLIRRVDTASRSRVKPYQYATVEVVGEARGFVAPGQEVILFADFLDGPAIAIQAGLGVVIRGITIVGRNRWDRRLNDHNNWLATTPPSSTNDPYSYLFAEYLDDAVFNDTYDYLGLIKCRDNVHSPYAGIVIDPFSPAIASEDRYPPLDADYDADKGARSRLRSTGIIIERCSISNFVVGVMLGPTGESANGEDIVIRDCSFKYNKVAFAVGHDQTRNVNFENNTVEGAQFVVDSRTYGSGAGTAPNIRGLSAQSVKYLFNLGSASTALTIDQVYCEVTLGIGFLSSDVNHNENGFLVTGSWFSFYLTRPMIDTHLHHEGNVTFVGCTFDMVGGKLADEHPPIRFHNRGLLSLRSCTFQGGRRAPLALVDPYWSNSALPFGFHQPDLVEMDGVRVMDNLSGTLARYSLRARYPSTLGNAAFSAGLARQYLPPGAIVSPRYGEAGGPFLRALAGGYREIVLPSLDLAIEDIESVSFAGGYGRLLPGDVVYCESSSGGGQWGPEIYPQQGLTAVAGSPYTGPFGVVTSVTPQKTIVRHVSNGFMRKLQQNLAVGVNGYYLKVKRLGRYHPPTTGVVTQGQASIAYFGPAGSFRVYDRIQALWGSALVFPEGTFIQAIQASTSTVLVSQPAQIAPPPSPLTPVRIFDADMYRVALIGE